jgi:hypothetical protein
MTALSTSALRDVAQFIHALDAASDLANVGFGVRELTGGVHSASSGATTILFSYQQGDEAPLLLDIIGQRRDSDGARLGDSSRDPRFNQTINPRFNQTINPKFNSSYAGPYLYDLDLQQLGYVVSAPSNILNLRFDAAGEWTGIMV